MGRETLYMVRRGRRPRRTARFSHYSSVSSGYYVTGITDPNGVTLSSGDKRFGSWSGWLFTVNGEMPILRYENGEPIYATLDS